MLKVKEITPDGRRVNNRSSLAGRNFFIIDDIKISNCARSAIEILSDASGGLATIVLTGSTVIPTLDYIQDGDIYVRTDTSKIYMATGVSASADWTILN